MRVKGTTLVEVLAACLILVVTVAGAFSAWQASLANAVNASHEHVAAELARADLEKAKAMGFKNLATDANGNPIGSYNAGTGIGTYTFPMEYYDQTGQPTTAATAKYYLQRAVYDYFVNPDPTNTTYQLDPLLTVRRVQVEVRRVYDSVLVISMGTNLVRGGL